jgi:hypothetical protein
MYANFTTKTGNVLAFFIRSAARVALIYRGHMLQMLSVEKLYEWPYSFLEKLSVEIKGTTKN